MKQSAERAQGHRVKRRRRIPGTADPGLQERVRGYRGKWCDPGTVKGADSVSQSHWPDELLPERVVPPETVWKLGQAGPNVVPREEWHAGIGTHR